ncbi:MAG: LysM peptidoglycan-binding domain-containing protein [Micromonosporaceae bacterium]|nr:LysM peptidoglycan-binding domain-containing protein [Micromonosporaceae bacterium]
MTPRGRLVVLVLLLALAGLGVALAAPATDAAPPAGAAQTVVVRPGDSLWSIAAHYRPGRDTRAVVERIRSLNGISGYTIHAGQRLILPKPS